jgi:hypothetical protein
MVERMQPLGVQIKSFSCLPSLIFVRARALFLSRRRVDKRQMDRKLAAMTWLAGNLDAPAKGGHSSGSNRETEPESTDTSTPGLRRSKEGLEDVFQILFGDTAASIFHAEDYFGANAI